jgi:hypothetical protein
MHYVNVRNKLEDVFYDIECSQTGMFRQALALARGFTLPVVLSRKTVGGACSSGIGSFVIVNKDGWIITAGHILEQLDSLLIGEQAMRAYEAQRAAIEADASIGAKEKKRRIDALRKIDKDSTDRCSAWWGRDGVKLLEGAVRIAPVDIGIGRLEPFDPSWCPAYPKFKDPAKNFEPGASLCTLGFPFHSITPQWDGTALAFRFPAGAVPLPFFPMDGIFTRVAELVVVDPNNQPLPAPPFRLRWIETSHPGLRGQSGGPIIDPQGAIWGIQSNTVHFPLGFDPAVPGRPGVTYHQFLNVGRGVHPETIFGLFDQFGVQYEVSSD